jgi:phenylpropionate dioxygenase-like ring-hydroxylating dioxygenase large terminal subunit
LGEAVVVFRDDSGKIGVLADRCAHRNLALSRGKVTADGLRCAYHGWAWAADGKCAKIPAACDPGDCAGIRVKSYVSRESQGFVWVWMAAEDGAEPTGGPLKFPGMGEKGWRYFVMEREFRAAAFHCVENFLDVPGGGVQGDRD